MARSLWSDRPLGVKLGAIVAAGTVSLGTFALISVQALNGTGRTTDQILSTGRITAAAAKADMMHDAIRADVLQALVNHRGSLYDSAVTDAADHSAKFRDILSGIADQHPNGKVDGAAAQASADQRSTAVTQSVLVAAAGVLVLAVLGWIVTRSVVGPLRKVGAVLAAMADGDLRATTGVASRDEVGQMAAALET